MSEPEPYCTITEFELSSGKITRFEHIPVTESDEETAVDSDHEIIIDLSRGGGDEPSHYVDISDDDALPSDIKQRPEFGLTIIENIISNLPNGTKLRGFSNEGEFPPRTSDKIEWIIVNDGVAEFPKGNFRIHLELFPYLDKIIELNT